MNMTEISMEERIAIRDSARCLKKYGSISNHYKRPETLIKHVVVETDTLQGIALKYGVTTESIRRVNKLWANDSLFLRKSLLIPLVGSEGAAAAVTSPGEVVLEESETETQSRVEQKESGSADGPEPNYNDFLVKIDCAIASTKSQIVLAQDNSQVLEEEDNIFLNKGRQSRSRLKKEGQTRRSTEVNGHRINSSHLPQVSTRPHPSHTSYQNHDEDLFQL